MDKRQRDKWTKRKKDKKRQKRKREKKKKLTYKKKRRQTYLKKKKADREIKGRELRDHRGIIFASLYTIIKTKWVISFYQGKINAISPE